MPFRNRVDPYGEVIVSPLRGRWMGNRGSIHRGYEIVRPWATKRWITCALEFKGWGAPQWRPGRWTALFFYDEALAFAAGHRPCALCRRAAYKAYEERTGLRGADAMDEVLHAQRLDGRIKRRHHIPWRDVPAGAFVERNGIPHIAGNDFLRPWSPEVGYGAIITRATSGSIDVLTPPLSLNVLRAGYPIDMSAMRE